MTTLQVRDKYKMQQWAEIIKECRSSGLPVKQWCSQNNVPEGSYYYWLKKARKMAIESLPETTNTKSVQCVSTEQTTTFTKITLPQISNENDVTLTLNGVTLTFKNSASSELIHCIFSEVRSLC